MFSPGYEEENKTKPALTLKLEESDGGLTPEKAAEGAVRRCRPPFFFNHRADSIYIYIGVKKGEFHITDTCSSQIYSERAPAAPRRFGSNVLKDLLFGFIGTVRFHASS